MVIFMCLCLIFFIILLVNVINIYNNAMGGVVISKPCWLLYFAQWDGGMRRGKVGSERVIQFS